jgi:hypothetical protein
VRRATVRALTSADIRALAGTNFRRTGARRAFVATDRATYGVLRMYVMLLEAAGDAREARVFYDIAEAERWLGVT